MTLVTMTLEETVNGMLSDTYKVRCAAEYQQVRLRYEKLKAFCNRIEAAGWTGDEAETDGCPFALLRQQQAVMGSYLHILEVRAIIEGIDLTGAEK